MGNNLPFGGKVLVVTGDFRQIPTIVKKWQQNRYTQHYRKEK